MCYVNGCKLSSGEIVQLREMQKQLVEINRPAYSGFNYRDWPVLKAYPGKKDFDLVMSHWEYIPAHIEDEHQLAASRKSYTWLNAKSENLLVNERGGRSMYSEGALKGRCLVLSTGFFESQHRAKFGKKGQPLKETEKIPYRIGAKSDKPYFFMAGVSRVWTNHARGQSADTFAIVTTEANALMANIHNTKKRMPTLLSEELAYEWLFGNLTDKRILEIASWQMPADDMWAYTVDKKYLENPDPVKQVDYPDEPQQPQLTLL